jgi:hypothetical protein
MTLYRDWSPTPNDIKGLNLPDRQDWIVGPCMLTRDSGPMSQSNFAYMVAALREAGTEGEDYETHTFNHWACGWFEIAVARPGTDCAHVMAVINGRLENYPYLDEEDANEREHAAAMEQWCPRDVAGELLRNGTVVQPTTADFIAATESGALFEFLQPEIDFDGEHPCYRVGKVDREALAKFIRMERAK